MAAPIAYTPLSEWTDNGDGSWTRTPTVDQSSYNLDAVLTDLLSRPRITVSATPPENPRPNDLWFQPTP